MIYKFYISIKPWAWRLMLLVLLAVSVSSCSNNSNAKRKKPHGKLKKGGRIPCPIKDC
jgi:hypothetical protein